MTLPARSRQHTTTPGALVLGQAPAPARLTAGLTGLAAQLAARLTGVQGWWRRLALERAATARLPAQLAFARGERALLSARDQAGGYTLVATDRALHHRIGNDSWSRLGWEQISAVSWDASASSLVVTGLAGAAPPRTIVPVRHRRTWPELAQERITHTRLVRQRMTLDDHRQVVIEIRRRPATDELRWALVSGRLAPGDHDLRQQVERTVADLYAEFGLTMRSVPTGSGSAGSRPAGSGKADLDGEASGPGLRAEGGAVDADDGQAEPVATSTPPAGRLCRMALSTRFAARLSARAGSPVTGAAATTASRRMPRRSASGRRSRTVRSAASGVRSSCESLATAAGEHLSLSPRTVGSHLYCVFPQLDISARGQLAARLAEQQLISKSADA